MAHSSARRKRQPRFAGNSNELASVMAESAAGAGRDARVSRTHRADGWTPERIRIFLTTLAECGVVEDACRAADMSKVSAYNLRNRAAGGAFRIAWDAAYQLARRRLADEVMSRALNGCTEKIVRGGEVIAERHRFDNRHTMAVLTRLDRICESNDEEHCTARLAADEFEQFIELVADGGEGAAEFVQARRGRDMFYGRSSRVLERLENYRRYGVGLPDEIDISDLDPVDMANWTEEQVERARRSGVLDQLESEAPDAEAWLDDKAGDGEWDGDPDEAPGEAEDVAEDTFPEDDDPAKPAESRQLLDDEALAAHIEALVAQAAHGAPAATGGPRLPKLPKPPNLPKSPTLPRGADGVPFDGPPPSGWVASD